MVYVLAWIEAKSLEKSALIPIDTAKAHVKGHIRDFDRLVSESQRRP